MTLCDPPTCKSRNEHDRKYPSGYEVRLDLAPNWLPTRFAHNFKVRISDLHAKAYHVGMNKGNM